MANFNNALDMAKTQIGLRALRYGHFPADIFDEYAWEMMLHMYIAVLRKQTMYVDNIVNLTSKNKSTGDRWIRHLVKEGLAELSDDRITLSANALQRMNNYHDHALNLLD